METAISLFITAGKNISTFQKGKNHGLLSLRDFGKEPQLWFVAGRFIIRRLRNRFNYNEQIKISLKSFKVDLNDTIT